MKKLLILSILGILAAGFLTAEGVVEFSGDIETLWGIAAPWTDKDQAGKYTVGETSFNGKLDAYYNESSALAEASITYDSDSNEIDLSVNELWADYTNSFWGIRIGRQKAAWGKADGIDITNVLCPTDMSSFAAMTSDDSKLAIDAVRFSLNGNQFMADAYWIPFFTPAKLPLDENNALRKFIVPASIEFPVEAMNTSLSIPVSIDEFEKPDLAFWNGEYGVKVSGYFSAFDLSVYGFYGWDDNPMQDYTITFTSPTAAMPFSLPSSLNVSGKYERMAMFGADAAIPVKEFVIRTEAAFFPMRHFQKSSEKIVEEKMEAAVKAAIRGKEPDEVEISEKRNQFSALAGVDWIKSEFTITAQYFCDVVFGDIDNLERSDAYEHGATLSISKNFLNETLEVSFSGLMNFNDFDSLLNPSVKYSLTDQINLGLQAFIFLPGPDCDGKYGVYEDLSSICVNAKFSF